MKKIFVIAEAKKGIFIEVENDVLTSVYQLQKEKVPVFGKSAELPEIQSDLINRFGKVDEVYVFAKDKLYATQFCFRDDDVKAKLDSIISKMKGSNLTDADFVHKTYLYKNTYLSSIFKVSNINSLKNFFKDLGWGEVKFLGPLELFLFINNVEQYKKSVLMPINNGFILYDNKKIFLSSKENLGLLGKGIDEIFIIYPDPLSDNSANFNEVKKVIPQIKQGRPWLTLKGIKTKPTEGIEWGYLVYYFENSSSWRDELNFVKDEKRKIASNIETNKATEKKFIGSKIDTDTNKNKKNDSEEYKATAPLGAKITPKNVNENRKMKKLEKTQEQRVITTGNLMSGFSFKPVLISALILILVFALNMFLPKVLPYKNAAINTENISLDSILKSQDTKILFKGENEFYNGKLYVLNDGSKDLATFIDKDSSLKEASALGLQIKVFEILKSNGIEISRSPVSN